MDVLLCPRADQSIDVATGVNDVVLFVHAALVAVDDIRPAVLASRNRPSVLLLRLGAPFAVSEKQLVTRNLTLEMLFHEPRNVLLERFDVRVVRCLVDQKTGRKLGLLFFGVLGPRFEQVRVRKSHVTQQNAAVATEIDVRRQLFNCDWVVWHCGFSQL